MLTPAMLGQTITVVDKSNKVVSNSKHLMNVFKEAKSAYRERKAEITATRYANTDKRLVRRALKTHTIYDKPPSTVSRSLSHADPHHRKPVPSRRNSGSSVARSTTSSIYPASNRRFEQDLHSPTLMRSPTSPRSPHGDLTRRHTTLEPLSSPPAYRSAPPSPMRSRSANGVDMDLAYGEYPMDLISPRSGGDEQTELKAHVSTVKRLLQEADCVHYSVTSIIATLQKNPEAMAAVALTLAEISNIVTKLSPGAVMALKGSAPAVFALLASPQFLIAAGVGVGVTIVAFGGYKIIKKIKAKRALEDEGEAEEMLEVGGDLGRIENWRRGISEAGEGSVGTSVEGEFITPMAARNLIALRDERIRESKREAQGLKSVGSVGGGSSRASRTEKTSRTEKESKASTKDSKKSKDPKKAKEKKEKKEKKPSPLRLMFT